MSLRESPHLLWDWYWYCIIHDALHLAMPGTAHRLFLAALIIASKFSNDISPRNKSWVQVSAGLFEIAEVNLMEKQFLFLLDFDLMFDEKEAISHFQPVLELLGADLKDMNSYEKAIREHNIKDAPLPPKRAILSFNPFRPNDANTQVIRRAVIDDAKERLEVRESALRRVARGSQERMARLPRSSLKPALSVAAPAPILIVPPRSSSRSASAPHNRSPTDPPLPLRPSRSSIRSSAHSNAPFPQSEHNSLVLSQSAIPERSNLSRRPAALGTVLARGPSTDSFSSESMGGLTADEGTSSSSVSLSEDSLDDEQDDDARVIRVVASLQIAADGHGARDRGLENSRIGTSGVGGITNSKTKWYGALQQQSDAGGAARRPSRFGWTRHRSDALKPASPTGDVPRPPSQNHGHMDRNYHRRSSVESIINLNTVDHKDSSRRHSRSSRSAFSASTSTIVGPSDVQMTTGPAPIGAVPTNRYASCATVTPSRPRVASFGSMGIPITTASASSACKQCRSDRATSSGSTKNAGIGMSISASIRNFLVGGGSNRDRERSAPVVPVEN